MSNAKEKKKPQIERFREKARELECDDSEPAFEQVIRKIVPKKPEPKTKKKAQ